MGQKSTTECVGCAEAGGDGDSTTQDSNPSERIFFQKWDRRDVGPARRRRPWVEVGVLLAVCAVLMHTILVAKRWRGRPSMFERSDGGDAGVMDQLVQREDSIDGSSVI